MAHERRGGKAVNESQIFGNALKLATPEERSAYLAEACAGDPRLRTDVEALLRAHANDPGYLEQPAGTLGGTVDSPPAAGLPAGSASGPGSSEQPGTVVSGRYKLLEEIGEGGMGTVYMAEQTRPVKRLVALKQIKAGLDSRQVLARFEAERQALALMDHPNIAKVLDAGATDSGRPYCVMELVKGVPITQFCDKQRLTPRERLELFIPVCQAVQHAHQKGITHRDLKPSNVLVGLYDGVPIPKVIDFGVAKAAGPKLTEATLYTGFGAVIGTPEYMSPEQARLDNLDIDTRSDIYSLGVLLYELLTGTTPLQRNRLKQAALLEVLRLVREEEPPRPSHRLSTTEELPSIATCRNIEPRKLSGLVRGELDWIVMKALEKDRNRRYETASGLAADLGHYLNDEPVQAGPPTARYRFRKFARRNKVVLITTALVAATLVLGTVVSTWQSLRAMRAEHLAQTRLETSEANLYVSRVNLALSECLANNVPRALELLDGCPQDLRGWEWDYASRQCHLELYTFLQSGKAINGVAFSPDGARVASVSGGFGNDQPAVKGDLVVRDVATGQEIFSDRDVASGYWGVAFSPDRRWLATGNASDLVIWNAATGKVEFRLTDPGNRDYPVLSLAFSPDSRRIIAGYGRFYSSDVGHANLRDLTSRKLIDRIPGRRKEVYSVAFSPDGREVALAGEGLVEQWDLTATPRWIRSIPCHGGAADRRSVCAVAFSPDGRCLASGGFDRTLRLWDRATGLEIQAFYGHEGFVRGLAFSPDGRWLVSASEDLSLKLWEVASGRKLADFHGHQSFTSCVAFRPPDGQLIASGGVDGAVKLWLTTPRAPLTLTGHGGFVTGLAFLPESQRLVSGETNYSYRGRLMLWDATTGDPLEPSFEGCPAVSALALRRDGRRLATVHLSNAGVATVRVRDLGTGQPVWKQEAQAAVVNDVAYSPDGRWLASAGVNKREIGGEVRLWDAETGREIRNFGKHTAGVHGVAFSPDSRWLASGWGDGMVRIWDAKDPAREARELPRHAGEVKRVMFLPDGRLASAGGRATTDGNPSGLGEVKIWDLSTGQGLDLRGHTEVVEGLACSPDGRRLATGSLDRTIKLWDTTTGEEVFTLRGHTAGVICVAFSPDGRRLASGGWDRTVRVWDTDPPASDILSRRGAESRTKPLELPDNPFAP
jgi:WD40 repeat protein/serine/threonine protein kinase